MRCFACPHLSCGTSWHRPTTNADRTRRHCPNLCANLEPRRQIARRTPPAPFMPTRRFTCLSGYQRDGSFRSLKGMEVRKSNPRTPVPALRCGWGRPPASPERDRFSERSANDRVRPKAAGRDHRGECRLRRVDRSFSKLGRDGEEWPTPAVAARSSRMTASGHNSPCA